MGWVRTGQRLGLENEPACNPCNCKLACLLPNHEQNRQTGRQYPPVDGTREEENQNSQGEKKESFHGLGFADCFEHGSIVGSGFGQGNA